MSKCLTTATLNILDCQFMVYTYMAAPSYNAQS